MTRQPTLKEIQFVPVVSPPASSGETLRALAHCQLFAFAQIQLAGPLPGRKNPGCLLRPCRETAVCTGLLFSGIQRMFLHPLV